MRVFIDKKVHESIRRFYVITLELHPALDEITVIKKVNRLYDSIEGLGKFPQIYAKARYRKDWQDKGYREFICEDFHFAYEICNTLSGEQIVRIKDAVHSLLYANPEDSIDNE